ncbi:glycosyltransferase, partial [Patescibacteria group bacterium]|nr:glycosyltransferase [Patescibacteria group bacterium]
DLTKDRPKLLANALRSIAEQTYANLEIVVVNDGGQDVRDVVTALAGDIPVEYIAHEKSRGRSAAANSALKAARGLYLNFLDDDDVFYPDHLETLVSAILSRDEKIVYSSVLSAHFNGPAENPENCIKKVVNHDIDFDPDRILFQNYLPIMSVLFHRDILSKVEGFSEDLTLFEDWDFWIRVSRHFHFHHIDKVTAEYRFYGAKTTEESHRQKYEYLKAQAQIFDRVTPFLTGEIWTKFLSTDLFDQLRHDGKCQNDRLEPARTELRQTTDELDEAHRQIETLLDQVQADKALLEEIFSSKGWRWLTRFRRLKVALSFGKSGIS